MFEHVEERVRADESMVELRGVVKHFGSVKAVQCLFLDVQRGEFLTFLGPSGCGKTTTLRLIGGFELPDSGVILIDGIRMGDLPPYKRPCNTVFQSYALFPHLTVWKNVSYALEVKGLAVSEIKRRVQESLELLGLAGMEDRKPAQLSGGEQQRVALARALVNRPPVLLLDEPLGSLDLKLRRRMQVELKELQVALEITFIYVTHDQEEAVGMSDRIGVMRGGELLQIGEPMTVYTRPVNSFVATFLGECNVFKGQVRGAGPGIFSADIDSLGQIMIAAGTNVHVPAASVTQYSIGVRPENVHCLPDGETPSEANAYRAVVQSIGFSGPMDRRVGLKTERGLGLEALLRHEVSAPLRLGDSVTVEWRPEDTLLMAD